MFRVHHRVVHLAEFLQEQCPISTVESYTRLTSCGNHVLSLAKTVSHVHRRVLHSYPFLQEPFPVSTVVFSTWLPSYRSHVLFPPSCVFHLAALLQVPRPVSTVLFLTQLPSCRTMSTSATVLSKPMVLNLFSFHAHSNCQQNTRTKQYKVPHK